MLPLAVSALLTGCLPGSGKSNSGSGAPETAQGQAPDAECAATGAAAADARICFVVPRDGAEGVVTEPLISVKFNINVEVDGLTLEPASGGGALSLGLGAYDSERRMAQWEVGEPLATGETYTARVDYEHDGQHQGFEWGFTIEGSYVIDTYTVTPEAGEGGAIDPDTAQTVDHGGTVVFAVTPDTGYGIATVTGCDGSLDGETYTTGEVTEDCTVEASFTVTLGAPQNVQAAAGNAEVTVEWDAVEDATAYNVYWSDASGIVPANAATYGGGEWIEEGVEESPHTVTGLDNGTEYYFVVTATADGAESEASDEVSATPTEPPFEPVGGLNDTGIDWWADGSTNFLQEPQAEYPGQDADFGRDADAREGTLEKIGGGAAGFDFTKLGADGEPLEIQGAAWDPEGDEADGTRWSCVHDNVTGLIWEVKVDDPEHLRHKDHTYTWYNSTGENDGGSVGTVSGGVCVDEENCDTEKFVAATNNAELCGASDWRMPAREELRSIMDYGRTNPTIDVNYFPNTEPSPFWSASPYAGDSEWARGVYFRYGYGNWPKSESHRVRLVRVEQ